ncbi:MAG: glycosyltransferase [Paludibacter sp.]|nr:glycosyltransferase [Paludibacter sp.]
MKKRIIISVTNDISTDQRVLKVANTLFENDFDVLLVGRELSNSLPLNLPFQTKRMRLIFRRKVFFYAEFNIRLFFLLIRSKADIFLANDTDTILANYYASKYKKTRLIFDAHEIFPETPELQHRKFVKKVWTKIESSIFPKLRSTYTVSQSVSDYYRRLYRMRMQVVRNVPYFQKVTEEKGKFFIPNKKIILYQGAINVGRGLEWVIDAMPYVNKNVLLVIIGEGDIKRKLMEKVANMKLMNQVTFFGKKQPDELFRYTKGADIGLCLLDNIGLSYYYSLPNRIFDYLRAGVPVLATDFPEIHDFVNTYNTGVLIDHYQPKFLAKIINDMLENRIDTSRFYYLAQKNCWENEEKILLKIIKGKL